jgi:hypothetical protein
MSGRYLPDRFDFVAGAVAAAAFAASVGELVPPASGLLEVGNWGRGGIADG